MSKKEGNAIAAIENKSVHCESFVCREYASWSVGNMAGPPESLVSFCEKCMREMLRTLPRELVVYAGADTEKEVFRCEICDKAFDSKKALGAHITVVHKKKEKKKEKGEKTGA